MTSSISNENNIDTSNWMENLHEDIGNKKLTQVKMPGTHDSATSSMSKKSKIGHDVSFLHKIRGAFKPIKDFKNPLVAWSKAQGVDTKGQLEKGARYFDFRVDKMNDGKFYGVHGLVGDDYESVFKDIKLFLEEHPKEILILDFQHFHNMDDADKTAFFKLMEEHLGNKIIPPTETGDIPTINAIWETEGRIIPFYPGHTKQSQEINPNLWPRKAKMRSDWKEEQSTEGLLSKLHKEMDGVDISENKFHVLQGVVTPDGSKIIKSLTPKNIAKGYVRSLSEKAKSFFTKIPGLRSKGKEIGLRQVAATTNPALFDLIHNFKKEEGKRDLNIVMFDHIDISPELVQEIISKNKSSP